MRLTITSLIVVILGICLSCEDKKKSEYSTKFDYVKYGTFFGNCSGYCIDEITLTPSQIIYKENGSPFDDPLPELTDKEIIKLFYWTSIAERIDFQSFLELDTLIGCPDCADGGGEWIEIRKDNISHRIIFEHGNEPGEVSNFIEYLRTYRFTCRSDSSDMNDFNERAIIDQFGIFRKYRTEGNEVQWVFSQKDMRDTVNYAIQYLPDETIYDGMEVVIDGVLFYNSTRIKILSAMGGIRTSMKARNIFIMDFERFPESKK